MIRWNAILDGTVERADMSRAYEEFLARHRGEIRYTIPPDAAVEILKSLAKNYYPEHSDPISDYELEDDILANLVRRQASFEKYLVPWINLRRPLSGATVVDIGCGTGSSTAALAQAAGRVHGYEIVAGPTAVAADRIKALRLDNAEVTHIDPKDTMTQLRKDFPDGVDVVGLVAVLEHMTVAEREEFLPQLWEYMRPGGIIVIAETPNRLTYNDDHTAQLPFFHLLPTELKTRYVTRSPRAQFVSSLLELASGNVENLELGLARWGIGVSFHDFELAFEVDRLETILLADGYEHDITMWWPKSVEEEVLIDYFLKKPINKPLGFCRSVLNLIFVKPFPHDSGNTILKHSDEYLTRMLENGFFSHSAFQRMTSEGTVGLMA